MTLSHARRLGSIALIVGLLGLAGPAPARAADPAPEVKVKVVDSKPMANVPGNSLTAVEAEFPPGASMPSHRHPGFVFAYVLSGRLQSQLNSGEMIEYKAGQSWIEPPGTKHTHIANPSKTEPARLLAVFIAPTGADLTASDK